MPRIRLLLLTIIAIVAVLVPAGAAIAGGGGCHGGPTQGTGDTVEMRDACFTPSTLHVDPGTTVTFVNRDPFDHNVSGMGWGQYESMGQGGRVSARFDDEGIYAYGCTLHPGMTGAVVVGDGEGSGEVAVAAVPPDDGPAAPEGAAAVPASGGTWRWLPAAIVGLAIGGLLGYGTATVRLRESGARRAVVGG